MSLGPVLIIEESKYYTTWNTLVKAVEHLHGEYVLQYFVVKEFRIKEVEEDFEVCLYPIYDKDQPTSWMKVVGLERRFRYDSFLIDAEGHPTEGYQYSGWWGDRFIIPNEVLKYIPEEKRKKEKYEVKLPMRKVKEGYIIDKYRLNDPFLW